MRIPLDRQSEKPLYQQIGDFFRQGIQTGTLEPGTRLPATRRLARDLGVNRITVETAYDSLEADGLVATQLGSGTYVLAPYPSPPPPVPGTGVGHPWPPWQTEGKSTARRGRGFGDPAGSFPSGSDPSDSNPAGSDPTGRDPSGIDPSAGALSPEELLVASGHPDPIDFSGGTGDPRLFPAADFRRAVQDVLRQEGPLSLGYGDFAGYLPLRRTIAGVLASQGLPACPENILITSGSQQALALVCQLLLEPGDTIVTESPTYGGALDLFHALGLRPVGIPTDGGGMRTDLLETALHSYRPGLIYVIPNFHNPTGTCLTGQRRRQLVSLAAAHNIPILEDDYVGDLRYEGCAQPTLKALDTAGGVLYVSTFSKMLLPGLRLGFLVADGPVFQRLVRHKRAVDLASSNLVQHALHSYITIGRYDAHLRRSRRLYRLRRDTMLEAIRDHLPGDIQCQAPSGGLFLWLKLPPGLCAGQLLPAACQKGIAFAPGDTFFPEAVSNDSVIDSAEGNRGAEDKGNTALNSDLTLASALDARHTIRLNFAATPVERIPEGIRRLGGVIGAWGR